MERPCKRTRTLNGNESLGTNSVEKVHASKYDKKRRNHYMHLSKILARISIEILVYGDVVKIKYCEFAIVLDYGSFKA